MKYTIMSLLLTLVSVTALANLKPIPGSSSLMFDSSCSQERVRTKYLAFLGATEDTFYTEELDPCPHTLKTAKEQAVIACVEKYNLSFQVCDAGKFLVKHNSGRYEVAADNSDGYRCQCDVSGILVL